MKPLISEMSVYALLVDGTTAKICPHARRTTPAVRDMHAAMSPDNMYLRFFNLSPRVAEQEAAPGVPRAGRRSHRAAGVAGHRTGRGGQL